MAKFNPKVSIIIPVYNGSNYLKEAIDSALAQTYKNIEVIVINDGSTDNGATEKIAKSYGSKIKYYRKKNGGVATALNFGIRKMTGDYFSWLSHDDKYKPYRTEKMIRRLRLEPSAESLIVASSVAYFTSSTEYSPTRSSKYLPSHPLSYLMLGYINGCAILIPKQIIQKEGFFNEKLPTTQDFEYWFRILRNHRILYLDDELTLSRSHEEQGSKAMLTTHVAECDELWVSMMHVLSKAEKENIFGSEFEFYNAVYDYLTANTLYKEATRYVKNCAFKIIREKNFDNAYKPDFIDNWQVSIDKTKETVLFPIFGSFADRGGLNKMISMVANRLSRNYNIIVASFSDQTRGYRLASDITYLHVSTSLLGIDSFESIAMLFEASLTVVSHNCTTQGLELIHRLKANMKAVVSWNHEDYFLPYANPAFSDLWPRRNSTLSEADAVIWLTNLSCAAYSLQANNGLVIPNFVHSCKDTKRINGKRVYNNIIAVARFDDPRKRIDLLLRVYEQVLSQKRNITLTILGEVDPKMPYSETESIGDAITRINTATNHIRLVGFVKDVERYYAKSDIHLLSSYCEGFGLTILESATHGVPTAVFNNSGFSDIISDGKNGIIAPEADTDALAQRIIELYDNQAVLLMMQRATAEILVKFDEDKIIEKWEGLVHDVIHHKTIEFPRYKLTDQTIKRVSDGFESSLARLSDALSNTYLDLREANARLTTINGNLSAELSAVYNSKRWKYTAKVAALKGRFLNQT